MELTVSVKGFSEEEPDASEVYMRLWNELKSTVESSSVNPLSLLAVLVESGEFGDEIKIEVRVRVDDWMEVIPKLVDLIVSVVKGYDAKVTSVEVAGERDYLDCDDEL